MEYSSKEGSSPEVLYIIGAHQGDHTQLLFIGITQEPGEKAESLQGLVKMRLPQPNLACSFQCQGFFFLVVLGQKCPSTSGLTFMTMQPQKGFIFFQISILELVWAMHGFRILMMSGLALVHLNFSKDWAKNAHFRQPCTSKAPQKTTSPFVVNVLRNLNSFSDIGKLQMDISRGTGSKLQSAANCSNTKDHLPSHLSSSTMRVVLHQSLLSVYNVIGSDVKTQSYSSCHVCFFFHS